jgi:hypothetical protein
MRYKMSRFNLKKFSKKAPQMDKLLDKTPVSDNEMPIGKQLQESHEDSKEKTTEKLLQELHHEVMERLTEKQLQDKHQDSEEKTTEKLLNESKSKLYPHRKNTSSDSDTPSDEKPILEKQRLAKDYVNEKMPSTITEITKKGRWWEEKSEDGLIVAETRRVIKVAQLLDDPSLEEGFEKDLDNLSDFDLNQEPTLDEEQDFDFTIDDELKKKDSDIIDSEYDFTNLNVFKNDIHGTELVTGSMSVGNIGPADNKEDILQKAIRYINEKEGLNITDKNIDYSSWLNEDTINFIYQGE